MLFNFVVWMDFLLSTDSGQDVEVSWELYSVVICWNDSEAFWTQGC